MQTAFRRQTGGLASVIAWRLHPEAAPVRFAHFENRLAYERAMMEESGGTAADRVKPEKGGACQCWASPGHGRGWSIIQKVNKVSVTLLDNWGNGGRDFTRTIPFDQLRAVMSKAVVEAKRAAGLVAMIEGTQRGVGFGFYLLDAPIPDAKPTPAPEPTKFDVFKGRVECGGVVSAPHLFPTPQGIARRVVELADIQPGMTVLEPSAGTGALLGAIGPHVGVTAVEINHALAESLRLRYPFHDVRRADFLTLRDELGLFDRIVMNPPFGHGSDIEHIKYAYRMLAPGGRLVAICANGPRQQEDRRNLFRVDRPSRRFIRGSSGNQHPHGNCGTRQLNLSHPGSRCRGAARNPRGLHRWRKWQRLPPSFRQGRLVSLAGTEVCSRTPTPASVMRARVGATG